MPLPIIRRCRWLYFDAYENSLRAKEVGDTYRADTMRHLRRPADECGFTKLADLQSEALED